MGLQYGEGRNQAFKIILHIKLMYIFGKVVESNEFQLAQAVGIHIKHTLYITIEMSPYCKKLSFITICAFQFVLINTVFM